MVPATFTNVFSLLNPEFATHDVDGSIFEIWKEDCAVGAAVALTADIRVMTDEMRLGLVTPAPITEDLPRPLKVTVVGSLTRQTSPQPRLNLSRPRAPLALPQP